MNTMRELLDELKRLELLAGEPRSGSNYIDFDNAVLEASPVLIEALDECLSFLGKAAHYLEVESIDSHKQIVASEERWLLHKLDALMREVGK